MFNWTKLCSDRNGYEALHEELRMCVGRYILDDVIMPDDCANTRCTITFTCCDPEFVSLSCEPFMIRYTGDDPRISEWLRTGAVKFRSYAELDNFLSLFAQTNNSIGSSYQSAATAVQNDLSSTYRNDIFDRSSVHVALADNDRIIIDADKLADDLRSEIFGQDTNISKIAHLVRGHLGTKEKRRPLSVFLYGAPGTGKSAIAELVAAKVNSQITDDKKLFYRPVDCTQFQERTDISRLTGAAPGYVGFDEPGVFSVLEDHPFTVFVFEEIEKADKNATEVIMQAMETGRQETNGKTLKNGQSYYDLSKCIIFFTSNVISDSRKQLGFSASESMRTDRSEHTIENAARAISKETRINKKRLLDTGAFRKEVISRMTAVIEFDKLSGEAIKDIAAKSIYDTAQVHRLCVVRIETPLFQEFLDVTCGEAEEFGARELRREAENYFNDCFLEYSLDHNDYERIILSGNLDSIRIIPESKQVDNIDKNTLR